MSRTSNPDEVTARLQSRMAAEHRQIEAVTLSEQRRHGESLRAVVNDGLRTIEADMGVWVGRVRVILLNAWLRPLVAGVVIFVGISGGSWGLMHWLSTGIQDRIETMATLEVWIEDARATLAGIEDTTWGVTLVEIEGERFVVLPDGTLANPPWTVDGRPALKLPSE
ncbi:MAG: hypothetical protein OYL41_07385 [Acidobacteriota bacterium]|nr:hypothetical protein [Acidobacteriota bacterium]